MTQTFTSILTQTFKVVSCYTCGVPFGITDDLYRRVVTDAKGTVFCPACGKETCWRESEDQKKIKELQRKLEWEMAEVTKQKNAKDAAEASLRATKGSLTKLTNPVTKGMCPCCNRSFTNLRRHMETKHPEATEKKP